MKNNEVWHLFDDTAHPPEENMNIDIQLLANAANLADVPLLRFYEWDRPAISIGYVQKENAVRNAENYTIVKRPTGGGIVYHDTDFTYTVVVPQKHWIAKLDRVESYRVFHKAVVRALASFNLKCSLVDTKQPKADRATMQCFVTPTKYDVLCSNYQPGKTVKVAGSAQRRTRNGILHQGSISLKPVGNNIDKLKTTLKSAFKNEFNISFNPYLFQREKRET
jgi:lipoate-protein ligase A